MLHASLSIIVAFLLLAGCGSTGPATFPAADGGDASGLASQTDLDKMACGPTCLYNQFCLNDNLRPKLRQLAGDTPEEKIDALITAYFLSPKARDKSKPRFGQDGLTIYDLADGLGEWRRSLSLPPLAEVDAFRHPEETSRHFVKRIHGQLQESLDHGICPVINIGSYGAMPDAVKADKHAWKRLGGHFVLVAGLEPIDTDTGISFVARLHDPWGGKFRSAYLYADDIRPFCACRSTRKETVWLDGSPGLAVAAPFLNLHSGEQPWYLRTHFVLEAAIGEIAPEKSHWTLAPAKPASVSADKPASGK